MESGLTTLLLCLFLDSYAFSARHQAHCELEKMGIVALPQLMLVSKDTKSLESYVRLKRLTQRQNVALVSYMVNGLPPYIDSIPEEGLGDICSSLHRYGVLYHYLQLAKSESLSERLLEEKRLCGKDDRWPEYRLAGRLWLEGCLAGDIDPVELSKVVKKLQERCVTYLNNNNIWPN